MYSSWHVAAVITAIIAHSFFSIWKDSTRNQSLWVFSSRHQTPQFQFYYPYHWTPWNSVSTTSLLSEHKLDFYICCLYGLKVIHNNSLEIWKMASYLPEITLMSKFPLKKAERRFSSHTLCMCETASDPWHCNNTKTSPSFFQASHFDPTLCAMVDSSSKKG